MADSNKNLVTQALSLTGRLAKAVGRPIDRLARTLLGPALKNMSDKKATVRVPRAFRLPLHPGARS